MLRLYTLIFQYDIHKNALKSKSYQPDLIELQSAPLTYSLWSMATIYASTLSMPSHFLLISWDKSLKVWTKTIHCSLRPEFSGKGIVSIPQIKIHSDCFASYFFRLLFMQLQERQDAGVSENVRGLVEHEFDKHRELILCQN